MPTRKKILEFLLVLWLVALAAITMPVFIDAIPQPIVWRPFSEFPEGLTAGSAFEVVGNVALFIPLGVLVPLRWRPMRSWPRIFLVGLALTILVEVLQHLWAQGRQPSVTDVMLNTLGTGIGFALIASKVRPTPR
jgi:glycopeptide antibiotics resistance protein